MRHIRPIKLGPLAVGRDNNFNLIRLLAAIGVFVSHTVMITQGREAVPQFMWSLGTISVWVFFAISGFLIAASFERRASLGSFAAARCLRIFPALIVCVLVTVFVLGPSQSSLGIVGYFADPQTYRFLFGNISLFGETRELQGVFTKHPAHYAQITFWSLKYEVLCYAALVVLGLAGIFRSKSDFGFFFFIATVFWLVLVFVENCVQGLLPEPIYTFNKLAFVFMLGMGAYAYRDHIYLSGLIVAVLVIATWFLWWTPVFHVLVPLTVAYGVLWAAFVPCGRIREFNRLGDYSYGVYIFGVPIQQVMFSALGDQSPFSNFVFSIGPTLGLAMVSWHMIEKPSLALRSRQHPEANREGGQKWTIE